MADQQTSTGHVVLVLPDEPLPVRFMNTIWADSSGVNDVLDSPAALRSWLTAAEACAGQDVGNPTDDELGKARLLRDALRRLAAVSTADSRTAAAAPIDIDDAVNAVNAAVAGQPHIHLVVHDGRLECAELPRGSAVDTALAAIARESIDVVTGPLAQRLRACYAPGCVLYFVKAHPRREWCSDACGNRVRAARHYQRTRARRG